MKTIVSNTNTIKSTAEQQKTEPTTQFSSPTNFNKRPVSLDLNAATPAKKQRLLTPTPLTLETPLNTPDLEKILLSSNLLQTPQPGLVFPSKNGDVTSEQEAFTKGFETALHDLHNSKTTQVSTSSTVTTSASSVPTTIGPTITVSAAVTSSAVNGMSGGSFTYTNLAESNFPVAIKDEPINSTNSPPLSPIDMESQEKIKLDRKRLRNRVAASKCRKRKLERISKLEDKVKMLKSENTDLGQVMKNLKNHVAQLKQQVIEHIDTGCIIPAIGSVLAQGQ